MSLEFSPVREQGGGVGRVLASDTEIGEILGCSRSTVWRRVADGVLPKPLKFGGLSRFVLSEVLARVEAAKSARDSEASGDTPEAA